VEAYCIQQYGAGTQGTVDRRDNGPMCTEKTSQGLVLLHHKIDPADICRTLHRTDRYRQEGPQVLCITGDETPAQSRNVDLADYCRKNYGQSAIVSRRLTDNSPLCTVKGDGGLSQTHHLIDLAELCGIGGRVSPAAVDGNTLDCAKSGATADVGTGSGDEGPGKGKPATGEPTSPKSAGSGTEETGTGTGTGVPQSAIVPISANPDLTGCGIHPAVAAVELLAFPDLRYVPPTDQDWQIGALDTPCPALENGFAPDLDDYCKQTGYGPKAYILPGGKPTCLFPDEIPPPSHRILPSINVSDICNELYPGGPEVFFRSDTGAQLIPVTKYRDGQLECFYIDVRTRPKYEIEYVAAEGSPDAIEELTVGTRFRVRLVFKEDPKLAAKQVFLTNKRTGQTIELKALPSSDPRVFLTAPVELAAEVQP